MKTHARLAIPLPAIIRRGKRGIVRAEALRCVIVPSLSGTPRERFNRVVGQRGMNR